MLARYILRHLLRPSLLAWLGLTTALFAKNILGSSNLLINQGLDALTIGGILLFQWVPLASQTAPFAIAIGLFAGLGRLSSTLELTAMETCGMSPRRLVLPVFAAGLLGAAATLGLSLWAVPNSARGLVAALETVARENPSVALRAGVTLDFAGWKLEAREVSASGRNLSGVLLWIPSVGDTIFAKRGRIEVNEGSPPVLYLELGSVLRRAGRGVERVDFRRLETLLPESERAAADIENPLRLLSLAALAERADDRRLTLRDRVRAGLERARRVSLPTAAAVFGLLAVPLFLHLGRPQGAAGAVIGLLLTLGYYGLVQFGEGLVYGGTLTPLQGAWLPNAACALLALLAFAIPTRPPATGVNRGGRRAYVGGTARLRVHRASLDRYVGRSFALLTAVAFAVLFSGYLLTDVLERLDWFERYSATLPEVLHFYSARSPLLASRMVPMAFLAGAALTLSQLAVSGELVAIRACGIAAGRGLAPILFVALFSVPGAFALGDWWVPRSNARADEIKVTEIKDGAQNARNEVWFRAAQHVFRAENLDRILGRAQELTIYRIGAGGLPEEIIDARGATRVEASNQWNLNDAIRYVLSTDGMREEPAPATVDLGGDDAGATDTMHLDSRALAQLIDEAEADGFDTTAFRVDYHVRLANPWAVFVLPAALLFLALALRPLQRSPALVMLCAIGIGIGYVLLTDTGAALGYGGMIPPPLGGWAVTGLFALVALASATRNFD